MIKPVIISKSTARRLAVYSSGLHKKNCFGKGSNAIAAVIKQLGYVQIDTISVVERAHHHVLWSRVPSYNFKLINKLQLENKEIFEYWAHAAAYLPMEDYRFSLPKKKWFKEKRDSWPKSEKKIKVKVLERIKSDGPLMSRDFVDSKTKTSGWWDWKPAKLALERLFLEGDIMISHRKGFQKVYDLPERCLASDTHTNFPTDREYAMYLIQNAIRSFGLVSASQISYLRPGMSRIISEELKALFEEEKLIKCEVNKSEKAPYYLDPKVLNDLQFSVTKTIRFLSPFDNLVIQRKRLKELFDFDYQIECYMPQAKRVYGYFSLPILYGDQFIGRADCKVDRKTKILHINQLVLENNIKINDVLLEQLNKSISEFAIFNNCLEIQLHKMKPVNAFEELRQLLKP